MGIQQYAPNVWSGNARDWHQKRQGNASAPLTLSQYIRKETENCREQANFMIRLSKGQPVILGGEYDPQSGGVIPGTGDVVQPDLDETVKAIQWVTDRAFGKAPQVVAGDEDGGGVQFVLQHVVPRSLPEVEQQVEAHEEAHLLTVDADSRTDLQGAPDQDE